MSRFVPSCMLLLLVLGLAACSVSKSTEEYIAYAQSFREQGDLDAAVVQLKNALQQSPDSAQARWILGSIYLETGDGEGAEKELRRCADLGMDYNEVVVPLMQAQLDQEKYQELIDTLFDEPSMEDEDLQEIWMLRGDAYFNLNDLEAADKSYDKALALQADDAAAGLGKARVAANRDSLDKARERLEEIFVGSPDYAPAWSFLGDIEQFQRNLEASETAYSKALEFRPENVYDLASRSLMRVYQNKLKSAEEDFQAARVGNAQLKEKQPLVLFVQGQLNLKRKKYSVAASAFDDMLKVTPDYLPARFFLAVSHYRLGNMEQAEQSLGMFRAKAPQYAAGHRLYAALKFSQGNFKEARQVLDNLLAFDPDDGWSLALLADVAVLEGNPEESVQNYRKIVELHPESEMAHLNLALGLMSSDQEAARKALTQAAEKGGVSSRADLLTIVTYMNSNEWDKAIEAAEGLIEQEPANWDAYTLLGGAYMGKGDKDESRKSYIKALDLAPGNPNAAHNLAMLELKAGNPGAARELYEDVLKFHPKSSTAMLSLSTLDAQQGKYKAASARLEKAMVDKPRDLSLKLAMARLNLRIGRPSRNLSLIYELKDNEVNNPSVLEVLGDSQTAVGQYDLALVNYKKLVDLVPEDPEAHYRLSQAYLFSDDVGNANKELDKVIALKSDHFGASVMRVRILRRMNRLDDAVKKLAQVDPAFADRPEILMENGWLSMHENKNEQAIASFQRAFELVPSSIVVIQLGIARWNAGKQTLAIDGYNKWLKDNPDDIQVLFHLGNTYMQMDKNAQAIKTFKTMLEKKPDDAILMNNIAWLMRETNPEKALEWSQRVTKTAPKWPPGIDTMGMILMEQGKFSQAYRKFEKASKLSPNNREFRYHLALVSSRMGEDRQAKVILRALLADPSDFETKKDAEALMQTLKSRG